MLKKLGLGVLRFAAAIVCAYAVYVALALLLKLLVGFLGFQTQPGKFLAEAFVWLSPLGAGFFILVVLTAMFFIVLGRWSRTKRFFTTRDKPAQVDSR